MAAKCFPTIWPYSGRAPTRLQSRGFLTPIASVAIAFLIVQAFDIECCPRDLLGTDPRLSECRTSRNHGSTTGEKSSSRAQWLCPRPKSWPTLCSRLRRSFAEVGTRVIQWSWSADPPNLAGANEQTLPTDSIATISSERSNQVVVDADVGIAGSYLVLSDSYSPDWRVSVDGRDAPLLRANGLFRAVPVPVGRHRVVFTYLPQSFLWSAAVSAIAGVAVMAIIATRRNKAPLAGAPTSTTRGLDGTLERSDIF